MSDRREQPAFDIALVLSGGNALGAYQAGAYQALHETGWLPDWVAGASAGAINGALICGNSPDRRVQQLEALWRPSPRNDVQTRPGALDEIRRTSAAATTLLFGQPGLFAPRSIYGSWWNPFGNPEPASLYDATPMRDTLAQLVDFDLLNADGPRFCATAIDVETGDDVVFDTQAMRVDPDHLRASAALLPAFFPVKIDGRLLADAGISANLPLDVVLGEAGGRPLLCIAIDLLPLSGPWPTTLGETVLRMQDLIFATQSRRTIASWQSLFDARAATNDCGSITLLYVAYSDHRREISGKAFDFSPQSARARWDAGHADMRAALQALDPDELAGALAGLRVLSAMERGGQVRYEPIHHRLTPRPA